MLTLPLTVSVEVPNVPVTSRKLYPASRVWICEMANTMRYPTRTWKELQTHLTGSFTARLHGLLVPEILLFGPEGEFGKVRRGPSRTEVTAGSLNAVIEQRGNASYRMLTTGTLPGAPNGGAAAVTEPVDRSVDFLEVRAGGRTYQARVSFLRNRATVLSQEGEEVARLKGNLTGRRYEVSFDPEVVDALPVVVLILYHTIIHRGRAFQTG